MFYIHLIKLPQMRFEMYCKNHFMKEKNVILELGDAYPFISFQHCLKTSLLSGFWDAGWL